MFNHKIVIDHGLDYFFIQYMEMDKMNETHVYIPNHPSTPRKRERESRLNKFQPTNLRGNLGLLLEVADALLKVLLLKMHNKSNQPTTTH